MKSIYERKISEGAQPYLQDGEEILSAFVARPRGWTQSVAGHAGPGAVAARLGEGAQKRAYAGADQADLRLASPMALAVTQRRLLVLEIGSPIGLGIGGKVKQLVSDAAIADVDSIAVKRLLLGKRITLTVRDVPIELEANALADAAGLAEAFNRAKAAG